jgi:hypothetical protein
VIYVPRAKAVRVNELEKDVSYSAFCFDPVTGEGKAPSPVKAVDGSSIIEPPALDHDWVLVLQQ